MCTKHYLVPFVVLSLLIILIPGCGGNGDKTITTFTVTNTNISGTNASPTPTVSDKPIKIGVLNPWSGPAAMAGVISDQALAVIEDQLKDIGGILGGRPIKFIRYDDGGSVAGTAAGWKKLVLDDNISAMVFGGAVGACPSNSSDQAEYYKIPYFSYSPTPSDLTNRQYTVRTSYAGYTAIEKGADFILNHLRHTKVALFGDESETNRDRLRHLKKILLAADVEIVYDEYYQTGTADLTPYLTKIKRVNPDVLAIHIAPTSDYITVFKQIMDLGGWGSIKCISLCPSSGSKAVFKLSGTVGTYHWLLWTSGLPYPSAQTFEQCYEAKFNRIPDSNDAFMYMSPWVAIKAIELAGTDDPHEVARVARSGNLQWDSPAGPLAIDTNGETSLTGVIINVGKGGEVTPVTQ